MFAEKYADEIQAILTKYPPEQRRAAVMPLLHLAQRDQMYVTKQAMSEIADILGISVKTVIAHQTNITEKLKIHSRAGLIKFAIQKGIIRIE